MIQIHLPPEIEDKLRDLAVQTGQDLSSLIVEALRQKIEGPPRVDAILAPFRAAFAQSRATDEELDHAVQIARDATWQATRHP